MGATSMLDVHIDPKSAALKVAEVVSSMPDATPDEVEALLHEKLDAAVLATQAAKALGVDTRSAAFFIERGDRIRREARQRKSNCSTQHSQSNSPFLQQSRLAE